jgi:regulatory protein
MQRSTQAYTFSQFCEKLRRYCAYQERCHKEVRQKLIELGADAQMTGQVIVQLVEENFLNEERFARAFAGGKFRQKQWGRNRIIRELKLRNISPYCIRMGLSEIPEQDYLEVLQSEMEKITKGKKSITSLTARYKVAQRLITKGFEPDLVWQMVRGGD